jgi:hypothetical protein
MTDSMTKQSSAEPLLTEGSQDVQALHFGDVVGRATESGILPNSQFQA